MKQIICPAWAILISSIYYSEGTQLGAGETNQLRQLPPRPRMFQGWAREDTGSAADIKAVEILTMHLQISKGLHSHVSLDLLSL
jgi:hypothetical protein